MIVDLDATATQPLPERLGSGAGHRYPLLRRERADLESVDEDRRVGRRLTHRRCEGVSGGLEALPVDLATGEPDPAGLVPRYDHLAAGVLSLLDVDPVPWLGAVPALGGLR